MFAFPSRQRQPPGKSTLGDLTGWVDGGWQTAKGEKVCLSASLIAGARFPFARRFNILNYVGFAHFLSDAAEVPGTQFVPRPPPIDDYLHSVIVEGELKLLHHLRGTQLGLGVGGWTDPRKWEIQCGDKI